MSELHINLDRATNDEINNLIAQLQKVRDEKNVRYREGDLFIEIGRNTHFKQYAMLCQVDAGRFCMITLAPSGPSGGCCGNRMQDPYTVASHDITPEEVRQMSGGWMWQYVGRLGDFDYAIEPRR